MATKAPPVAEDLLIRQSDAARMLAISDRKLWSLTKQGIVPCVKVGKTVRYSPEALREFVARGGTTE
ncbi:MAG TPA: helix-turn-helix domain-containing protein [Pirellulaceae bacterium]|nr:helix-turn-helix domain-containing protein [Pirellulaceae bacterium]